MLKFSLPFKVGFLMALAIMTVSAAGYLTYESLSSIVKSIQVSSKPDLRLLTIRKIATDLDKAENSVRLYTLTRRQEDIKPYYDIIAGIDDKIQTLRNNSNQDLALLMQIDTISGLISENLIIWNSMLDLHHTDSLDIFIRRMSARVAVASLNKKNSESILKRVFGKKSENTDIQQSLMDDLNRIEQQDSLKNSQLLAAESRLAITGNAIRERLYILISRMEEELVSTMQQKADAADVLALKTYRRLALFAILGTLLVILVLIVVVRFVRKTREYQKALENSMEETEQLARTRALFMANMSHEIRTPVNAIYGFTEQLLYEPADDKSRKMLGIIKSSADHLARIVNDILDFSKLQNGRTELEKFHFQIQLLCEEIILLFKKKAADKNNRLTFHVSSSTPQVLLGDAYRLKQIVLNLMSNAVKFTENGEIALEIDCDNLTDSSLDLIVTVQDSGVGISPGMQKKVFDEFTQAEANTSRKYGGTGLGLSIVKKLVELHQGKISLESRENLGTRVTCRLPYEIGHWEQIPASGDTLQIPDAIRKLNVLIVDDEEYNRLLFKVIFSRWQVGFHEAENGLQAIAMIKSGSYDLVFMDVHMPRMDGFKATTIIRQDLGKSNDALPIIGISATHTTDDLKRYLIAGMNTFLPKPFSERMLLDTILSVKKMPGGDDPHVFPAASGLNLDNLYHLADHDKTFVRQLILSFMESTRQGLAELTAAMDKADDMAIREIAHKISSPCRHIGAVNLYTHLKSIEELAQKPENIAKLVELLRRSSGEYDQIKMALEEHLAKIGA